MAKQKVTKKQQEARIKAAQEREERAKAAQERRDFLKRVGIFVVCLILVLALGLPVTGLLTLGAA